MKKISTALIALGLACAGVAGAEQPASADTLVWCGLDYSRVKMIGTMDFRQPQQIFPGMLEAWNGLFMKEMFPQLEKVAKSVQTDLDAVGALNSKASDSQIQHADGSREEMVVQSDIKESDIAESVRAYKLKSEQGMGLVFLMDRLVKAQETACYYVVFFDIATRKVLHSERLCEKAGGMGFRNYWFNPIKSGVKKLPKMYKQAKGGS